MIPAPRRVPMRGVVILAPAVNPCAQDRDSRFADEAVILDTACNLLACGARPMLDRPATAPESPRRWRCHPCFGRSRYSPYRQRLLLFPLRMLRSSLLAPRSSLRSSPFAPRPTHLQDLAHHRPAHHRRPLGKPPDQLIQKLLGGNLQVKRIATLFDERLEQLNRQQCRMRVA